jgi:DNA-binding NarL/FixJ family response regulator
MQSIRIAILDVNDLSRFGLQALVERLPNATMAGAFNNLNELEAYLQEKEADILLMDDTLPRTRAIDPVIDSLHARYPALQIMILSKHLNQSYIQNVLQHHVQGYIYKEEQLAEILAHAVQMVRKGNLYLSPQVSALPYTAQKTTAHARLRTRDLNVLYLMQAGKTVQEIAMHLNTSDRVIYHIQSKLRAALDVPTNELIIIEAAKQGWITHY